MSLIKSFTIEHMVGLKDYDGQSTGRPPGTPMDFTDGSGNYFVFDPYSNGWVSKETEVVHRKPPKGAKPGKKDNMLLWLLGGLAALFILKR